MHHSRNSPYQIQNMSSKYSVLRGLSRGDTRKRLPQVPQTLLSGGRSVQQQHLGHPRTLRQSRPTSCRVLANQPRPFVITRQNQLKGARKANQQRAFSPTSTTNSCREREDHPRTHPLQPESSRDTAADLTPLPFDPSDCDCRQLTGLALGSIGSSFSLRERWFWTCEFGREKLGLDSFLVPSGFRRPRGHLKDVS